VSLQGLDRIHDQIDEDLLDLNLVDMDRRERLFEVILDRCVTLFGILLYNSNNFTNYVWNVDIFLEYVALSRQPHGHLV